MLSRRASGVAVFATANEFDLMKLNYELGSWRLWVSVHVRATHAGHVWSWDFIFDRTESGQTLKIFTIIDEYTRRCITLDVSRSFKAEDIINRLSELFVMYGMPEHIRSDNGPEFIAKAIRRWQEARRSDAVRRARQPLGEWLCREFSQSAAR
jgi:transposase InsO family protein